MVFVCDLGFSSLKWVYGKKKGRIVSAYRRSHEGLVVGEDALLTSGSSYLKTLEDLVHHYPAFVTEVAAIANVPSETSLVVGLPYGAWVAEKDKDAGVVKTLTRVLNASGWTDVRVLPQGLGGVRLFLNQNQAQTGNILAVDIGFNTVIFTLVDGTSHAIIYGDTFYKRGVHQMATQLLLPTIRDLAPSRTFSPVEISYLIERGYVQYGFERHDITGEIETAAKAYIDDVLCDISGELQAHLGLKASFETVLIFGGGAILIRDIIQAKKVSIEILQEPEYANALGFALAEG
ncbi:ParM/StbA family protein [Geopsychrobacter electrodiphilus]|uniref:ParM/StbA family protein n=1 Tax=Geopsychrobacter electrodiphilus TaxID=225196 RepID=UPI0003731152|nr:ParM/StbA family protein [Geopsychrobacter electrodiphilus]